MTDDLRAQLQATLGDAYTLESELGGGGMSRVFVAEDKTLRRRIVVKVLPPELAAEISVARFEREIAHVAQLQHPHIVPLLAAGETAGCPWYTMPLIEGESLRARLARDGELPVAEAVRLLREMAGALEYAHSKGIVHRDIKPENVLVTGGIALVTDFGVAKAVADATMVQHQGLTSIGIALGTPTYMAPEQASADPAVDHRADLYALGVVAYEMLAGQPPFAGRTTQGLLAAHLTEAPEPLVRRRPAVPAALAALVMRCLEKRPADRPQRASEIVHELDAVLTTGRITASPRAVSSRVSRPVLAGIALAVVAAAGWLVFSRFGHRTEVASRRVLVLPFENLTGDARFTQIGLIAADRLAQGVAQAGSIDIVPSNTVLMMLRDTTGSQAERLRRVAAVTHAGVVVSGTVVLRRDSLVIQAQASDVRTGTVLVALPPASGPAADPIAAVDALRDRLLGALASREMTQMAQTQRAPTYAAYQAFAAGYERFALHGDNRGSRPFFLRAIALDSTYFRAYQLLARQYLNAGEYPRADSLVRRMERFPNGISSDERLQLGYMQAELEGDVARMLRAQQQIAARDSSAVALTLIGEASDWLLQPGVAIPALERSDSAYQLIGGSAVRMHAFVLTEAYHEAGAHDRELSTLLRRRSAFRSATTFGELQLRALAGLRRGPAAVALADTLLRTEGDSTGEAATAVTVGALEFRAHGDGPAAARLLAMAREWFASHPAHDGLPTRTLSEGISLLASGQADSAAARFASITRDTSLLEAAGYLGLAQAARGNRARAHAIADSLSTIRRRWIFGENTFWRAAIVGALGERELAVQLLQQANREGQQMQSWHYVAALDSLHGYAPFEALIRPRLR